VSEQSESFAELVESEVKRVGFGEFSQRYNISKSTLQRWLSGKSKPVKGLEEIIRLDIRKQRELYE